MLQPHTPYATRTLAARGFTLLELSIALVVIALIVGGIIAAKDVQRNAQLSDIIASTGEVRNAFQQFRDKYGYLPGDFPRATGIWGAAAGTTADGVDATCDAFATASTTTPSSTCNGDGNGNLGNGTCCALNRKGEIFRAWQHLANAGLISGVYTGVNHNGVTIGSWAGSNVYGMKRPNTGISVKYSMPNATDGGFNFMGDYGNVFYIGSSTNNGDWLDSAAVSPLEAYRIDSKMDDGRPGTGILKTHNFKYHRTDSGNCIAGTLAEKADPTNMADAGNTYSQAQYDISDDKLDTSRLGGGCAMIYETGM